MMARSRFSRFLLALALALAVASPAWAAGPQGFVKAKQGELVNLLKQPKSAANDKKVEKIFDGMLDYEALARESLDKHWDKIDAKQQKEFQSVLKQLVRNAYRKNLDKTLDYQVTYKGETKGKKGIVVRTVAKHRTDKRKEAISIDYVLHQVDGEWRIFDIVTEGSSLVNNYRNQFRRVIKKKGFDELLRRMKKKLGKDS